MRFLFLVMSLLISVTAFTQRAVPERWGHHVHDEAHILSQITLDLIEKKLTAHEDSTSNQIALLIIPSLDGEVLEEYSLHVAHDVWKLGTKKNDNGVLLLIVIDDHTMRIEVGDGLEGVLTDALTNRIIRNQIAPRFREKNFDAGVTDGLDAIIAAIAGEYTAADNANSNTSGEMDMNWTERLLIGIVIFTMLGIFTAIGIRVQGCAGWFIYAFLIPFYATFPTGILGPTGGWTALGVYAIGFPILKLILVRTTWGIKMSEKMNGGQSGSGRSGSGWSSGGSSRSSSSSGGGSFSGGGSSGSW